MTGHMPGPYWQITWRFVGPVLISVLLVASIIYRSFDKPAYYAWNAKEVEPFPSLFLYSYFPLFHLFDNQLYYTMFQ